MWERSLSESVEARADWRGAGLSVPVSGPAGAIGPQALESGERAVLVAIYGTLLAHYGPQRWWPTLTGSRWEVMVGAVLVQRTTWRNAERALANLLSVLGREGLSDPVALLAVSEDRLAEMLRPAGHFNRKPRTLKILARLVLDSGGAEALALTGESTADLRARLLDIWGIGPETADAILLYALDRPVFVADAYALRLGVRWGVIAPNATYDEVRRTFSDSLPADRVMFNEYHALIVEHGKQLCRPVPRCDACPLNKPIAVDAGQGGTLWRCPRRFVAKDEEA
jgi:endonuclease-3 related protein